MYRSLLVSCFLAAFFPFAEPPCLPRCCQKELPDYPVLEHLVRSCVTLRTSQGTGSGSLIVRGSHAFVLTAGHCVSDKGEEKLTVYKPIKQEGRMVGEQIYKGKVIFRSPPDSGQDVAVIHLQGKGLFKEGLDFYLGAKIPPLGTRLYHCGAPLGESGCESVLPAFYSQHGREIEQEVLDQITCSTFPGSSGGMVTLEDGRLIGMVTRGEVGGFILIKPIRIIRQVLDEHKLSWVYDPKVPLPKEYK